MKNKEAAEERLELIKLVAPDLVESNVKLEDDMPSFFVKGKKGETYEARNKRVGSGVNRKCTSCNEWVDRSNWRKNAYHRN